MIRFLSVALAAIVAVSFTVAFAVRLASPREDRPQTAVRQAPVGGPSSPVVADRARLRSVAALPALRVPPATPTPPAPTLVVAPEPTPVAPLDDEAAPLPAAPAPAPPKPEPSPAPTPTQHGPTFDSSG
jgi:periplasmic protein TonB